MLPHSIFFHISKTGGIWVRKAIENAGIPTVEVGKGTGAAQLHNLYSQVDRTGKFTFTFVRHPLEWYPSFWSYRMMTGWQSSDPADSFMSIHFEKFVRNTLRYAPGHVSWRYEQYVGPEPGVLDFVGKTENMTSDLIKALRLAGEEFNEEKLLHTPRYNVSLLHPVYSDRLREVVLESERKSLERFGYGKYSV